MKLFLTSKSRRGGFTLIELLVVIAIISLLSSVVLAALNSSRDKAQQTAYRQYLGEAIKGIELYRSEGGDMASIMSVPLSSTIDSTDVGNFIKKTSIPSFVTTEPFIFDVQANFGAYTCENDTESDYFIYFESGNSNLNFRRIYQNGSVYVDPSYYYYCVSPSLK